MSLRPADDGEAYHVGVDLARVRVVADLDQAAVIDHRRAERRRRLAEPHHDPWGVNPFERR